MSVPSIEKAFCTTREAALLLGVSVGTVQLWVESGLLEAWKTAGGHRRVMRDSVDRLLRKAPGAPPESAPPTPKAREAEPTRKFQVMVVDDNAELLRLYQAVMGNWPLDMNLVTMNNAFSALVAMGNTCPDLLITDLHMPGMDGFEMLRAIRMTPALAATQVVVVSGLDAGDIARRGGIPEGIDILPKPVPFPKLRDIATRVATAQGLAIFNERYS